MENTALPSPLTGLPWKIQNTRSRSLPVEHRCLAPFTICQGLTVRRLPPWGRHTSTGTIASSNHTGAVDPRVIPYGSKILINGVVYTAEDKGGAVRGNHIDIFFDTHGETRMYGTQSADVYLLS